MRPAYAGDESRDYGRCLPAWHAFRLFDGAAPPVFSVLDSTGKNIEVFSEHLTGLDFYLNADMIDAGDARHVRDVLQDALKVLERRTPSNS